LKNTELNIVTNSRAAAQPRSRVACHLRRRGGRKVEPDEDVDDGSAEGGDPSYQHGGGGDR
jgi:hypothetical protein